MFYSSLHPPTLAASTASSDKAGSLHHHHSESRGWDSAPSCVINGPRVALILAGLPQPGPVGPQRAAPSPRWSLRARCAFVSLLCRLSAVMSNVSPWQPRPVKSSSHRMVSSSTYTLAVTQCLPSHRPVRNTVSKNEGWHRGECGQVPGGSGGLGAWGIPACEEALSSGLGRTSSPKRRRMTRRVRSSLSCCLEGKSSCLSAGQALSQGP